MIWGAASVTAATLAQVGGEGHVLLGFNEPDLGGQANMSVGAGARPVAQADGHRHDAWQPRGGVGRGDPRRLA